MQLHHDRAVTTHYSDKLLMRKAGARLLTCLHAEVRPDLLIFSFSLGAASAHNAGGRYYQYVFINSEQIFFTKEADGRMISTCYQPL